jgi:bleomycin hydrolase
MIPNETFIKIHINSEATARRAFAAVQRQLDATGEPVRISLKWTSTFMDRVRGLISIDAFNPLRVDEKYLSDLANLSSDSRNFGHAVDVVDYDIQSGQPVKLLILNSHGETEGDQGYYHLYWDFFRERCKSVSVYADFVL